MRPSRRPGRALLALEPLPRACVTSHLNHPDGRDAGEVSATRNITGPVITVFVCQRAHHKSLNTLEIGPLASRCPMPAATMRLIESYFGAAVSSKALVRG